VGTRRQPFTSRKRDSHGSSTTSRSNRRSNVFPRPKSGDSILSLNINPGFESTSAHELYELNKEEHTGPKKTVRVEVNLEESTEALKEDKPTENHDERDEEENSNLISVQGSVNGNDANEDANFAGIMVEVVEEKGPIKGIEMEMVAVQLAQGDN